MKLQNKITLCSIPARYIYIIIRTNPVVILPSLDACEELELCEISACIIYSDLASYFSSGLFIRMKWKLNSWCEHHV
jgi:hypothetical protein